MSVWLVLVSSVISHTAAAQEPPGQATPIPAVVQSDPEFYGAVGSSIGVEASLESSTVELGRAITLMLRVTGARNPNELIRPPLETIPAWTALFQMEEGLREVDRGHVTFRYFLKPRAAGTVTIPRIRYRYFNPAAAEGKQRQTAYTDALTLTVRQPPAANQSNGREIPERFREAVPVSRSSILLHPMSWLIVIPVSLAFIPAIHWFLKYAFPSLSAKTRSAAAQRAFKRLNHARQSEDPAALVASALNDYLAIRPTLDRTHANELLARCDEVRFSVNRMTPDELIRDAKRLLAGWEAES